MDRVGCRLGIDGRVAGSPSEESDYKREFESEGWCTDLDYTKAGESAGVNPITLHIVSVHPIVYCCSGLQP